MPKSFFSSLTVNASLVAAATGVVSFVFEPTNYSKAADCFRTFGLNEQASFISRAGMLIAPMLSIVAVAGRMRKGDLYTPPWMPGPNKKDLEQKEISQSTRLERSVDQVIDLSNRVLEVTQVFTQKPMPTSKPERSMIPPEDPHDFSAMLQQIESESNDNSGFLN